MNLKVQKVKKAKSAKLLGIFGLLVLGFGCLSACSPTAAESAASTESAGASEDANITPTPMPTVNPADYAEIALPQLDAVPDGEEIAVMETGMGTIKMRFFSEYAPKAVENFKTHAKNDYYNGTTFHRVINEFMIQGGDPRGDGTGGQSIWGDPFEMEIVPELHHIRGALAMANSGAAISQGSQFFIVQNKQLDQQSADYVKSFLDMQNVVADEDENGNPIPLFQLFPTKIIEKYLEVGGYPSLDFNYTIFGHVVEGMDVVDKIAGVETSPGDDAKRPDRPLTDVTIDKITFENYKAQ